MTARHSTCSLSEQGNRDSAFTPRKGTRPSGEQQPRKSTDIAFKSPKRISITIPHNAYEHLIQRSDQEGRSLSNLAAYLLESALGSQEDIQRRIP